MILSKKMGRPTDNPKNKLVQIRVDDETLFRLDSCVNTTKKTRSEIIRRGINLVYDDIKK